MPDVTPAASPPHRPASPPGAEPVTWIRFECPRCGKRNKAPAQSAGKTVCCARCQGTMTAPGDERAKPTLDDLSAHVASRGGARRRRRYPWWLFLAHLSIPVAALFALYRLRETGHLPWIDPYVQQLKALLERFR